MFKSGVGFHYNVNNCERTLEFYTEKLGFNVLFTDEYKGQAMVTTNDYQYSLNLCFWELPIISLLLFQRFLIFLV